jgi:hypothetical protein
MAAQGPGRAWGKSGRVLRVGPRASFGWERFASCVVAVLSGPALAGCGGPHVVKPTAPDMSELVALYERPDAAFDSAEAADIASALVLVDTLLERTSLREQLVDVLRQVLDEASGLSEPDDDLPLRIEADGYMLVTRICSGWAATASPDRTENGALLVNATFSERGLDPIVWGTAAACRYLSAGARVQLDQPFGASDAVSVYWGESVERENLEQRALLVDMNLAAAIEDQPLSLDFDFRSLENGNIEYRIPRRDGSLVAEVVGDRVRLRAVDGTYDCDRALRCRELGAEGGD